MKCFLLTVIGFLLLEISSSNVATLDDGGSFPSSNLDLKNDTLIFAHVIFRHGARNIEKPYPNDPYKDERFWPPGFGQLTKVNFN